MNQGLVVERLFDALTAGDRALSREIVREAEASLGSPAEVIERIAWPVHEMIDKMHRADQLSRLAHQFATRLLRALVDQLGGRIARKPSNGKRVFTVCGPSDGEDLGAQMAVDILDAEGYTVLFAGGGIPADEVLEQVHRTRPDVLLIFSSAASDLPGVRMILDSLREINGSPNTKIAVGGGVFNRAPGLHEELNIDLYAETPRAVVEQLIAGPRIARVVEQKAPVRRRKAA
ncbi:MAG: cobalamin B12-binding domain-containing protein [Phycisphaeraceae bacterium]|nr:MAG: cobalamin B12-binding domain-containing protein [Phycisphaeraceae bacterium]